MKKSKKIKKLEILGNVIGVLIIIIFVVGFICLIDFTNKLVELKINNIVHEIKKDCNV